MNTNNTPQHFLRLDQLTQVELQALLDRAIELKAQLRSTGNDEVLKNKTLAMIFNKSSTRTRVSFDVGMRQLGGGGIYLNSQDTQMGRGEPLADTAKVVSSMVDGVMIRTHSHADVEEFANHSSVPVINGLTDLFHPCQLLADLLTWQELRGSIRGANIAWIGDGNNVCHSWMNAARLFDFTLQIATPKGFEPDDSIATINKGNIVLQNDPKQAANKADLVVTDTWASMGQESEKNQRAEAFNGFCIDEQLMALANKDALFMHCLPAYRGSEVTANVIDGPQSVVFQEAENRLHAQKALLEKLLS